MAPGAFRKTLSEGQPVLQFDHGRDARTGSVPIGKIDEIREDANGLYVKAPLFDNPVVEPIRQAIQGGAIRGMSFRFKVNRDEWRDNAGKLISNEDDLRQLLYKPGDRGPLNRTVREVQLFEVGPVVFPAYDQTSVGVRSLSDEDRDELIAEYQRTMATIEVEAEVEAEGKVETEAEAKVETEVDDDTERGMSTTGADGGDAVTTGKKKAKPSEKSSDDPQKPYGDVVYADPGYQKDGKKRYPVDTADHAKAAWSYINKPHNAEQYTADQLAKVKASIKAACAKFGIDISESKSASTDDAGADGATSTVGKPEDAALSGTSHREAQNTTIPVTRKAERSEMKTLEEFRARRDEILARLGEIGDEYRDAALSDEAQGEWDDLVNERASVEKNIDSIEKRTEVLRGLAAEKATTERGSDRGAPAFHKSVDIFDVDGLRTSARSSDDFAEKVKEYALRAVDAVKFPGVAKREKAQESVAQLLDNVDNEHGDLARRLLMTGSPLYERAFGKAMKACSLAGLDQDEQRALSTSNSAGGYAVPFQLDPTVILTNAGTVNPLRQIARQEQIVGKQWQGVTSAGVTVSRGAEAAVVGDNSFTLTQPVVSTNRVQGFVPFSIEIDIEWGQLRNEITTLLQDAKDREEATSFTVGDGTGVNANGVVATLSGNTVTTASIGTFAAADLYSLETALDPRWRLAGKASFLANKGLYQAVRQFDTAGGSQLWVRVGAGQPSELLGYPSYEVSDMSALISTAGAKVALLGDFSNFLIVDRIGMNVELVPQVFDPTTARPTGQRGIYAIWMNNSKILVDAAFKLLVIRTS
jgi:HK97 family phage major capsid protein/HK97 family phage prohead protease